MKIWLINHYAVPPQYYPLARPSLFAKNLIKMGHDVTIIAASTVHNSKSQNLIEDGSKVKKITDDGIPYVLINCRAYEGNGIDRVINILQFARRLSGVLRTLEQPDAIVATSFDPFTCYEGIKYAKRNGIKAIAEIADLWPETLVAYNGVSPKNPAVLYLRSIEKKIYTMADRIVFTMEGAYDYIKEQQWENDVSKSKVAFINNGIDLEMFDYNKENYITNDDDLKDESTFKVVYTGAIRKVNNLGILVDAAKKVNNHSIRFLIWGDGDDLESLKERVNREHIDNVIFKGRVQKKYVPYITSCADLNIIHGQSSPILRFGLSPNKMFDYLAAGKPILIDFLSPYNPAKECHACVETVNNEAESIARAIDDLVEMNLPERNELAINARKGAHNYDFAFLTSKLIDVVNSI